MEKKIPLKMSLKVYQLMAILPVLLYQKKILKMITLHFKERMSILFNLPCSCPYLSYIVTKTVSSKR